ncbi:MAG: hypothetical protein RR740_00270 [Pseudomonas sp.]
MAVKVGDRVGAFLSATDKEVQFLGYGVFEGEYIVPKDVNPVLHQACHANPRIKLDNGDVVWGCECYWGNESGVEAYVSKLEVKTVSIKDHRS